MPVRNRFHENIVQFLSGLIIALIAVDVIVRLIKLLLHYLFTR
ncbi:MAG: hypothetical protein JWQ34_700 [Mucilaginibacter sp.]|nr:hypothetical protein [Mucilaginibacter sp.]